MDNGTDFTPEESIKSFVFISIFGLIGTVSSLFLIDYLGRKLLLLITLPFLIISLLIIGLSQLYLEFNFMIEFGLMMYLLMFSMGMSPVPWVYNSEIYPLRVREFCCSVATSANWLSNFIISLIFPILIDKLRANSLGQSMIWFTIGLICFINLVFVN